MKVIEWIHCPACGNKTRNRVRENTVLINFPLYCPKCKQESIIEVKKLHLNVIKSLLHKPYTNTLTQTELETLCRLYGKSEGKEKEILFCIIHKYGADKMKI